MIEACHAAVEGVTDWFSAIFTNGAALTRGGVNVWDEGLLQFRTAAEESNGIWITEHPRYGDLVVLGRGAINNLFAVPTVGSGAFHMMQLGDSSTERILVIQNIWLKTVMDTLGRIAVYGLAMTNPQALRALDVMTPNALAAIGLSIILPHGHMIQKVK